MKRNTLLKNLRSHLKWAQAQTRHSATHRAAEHAADILCGVFDLLEYLPTSVFDDDAWLDRPIHGRETPRPYLDRIRTTFYRGQGKQAFCGLLAVVIEVLEAATWIEDLYVGSLPVKGNRSGSGGIARQRIRPIPSVGEIPVSQDPDHAISTVRDQSHQDAENGTVKCHFPRVSDANFGLVADSVQNSTEVV